MQISSTNVESPDFSRRASSSNSSNSQNNLGAITANASGWEVAAGISEPEIEIDFNISEKNIVDLSECIYIENDEGIPDNNYGISNYNDIIKFKIDGQEYCMSKKEFAHYLATQATDNNLRDVNIWGEDENAAITFDYDYAAELYNVELVAEVSDNATDAEIKAILSQNGYEMIESEDKDGNIYKFLQHFEEGAPQYCNPENLKNGTYSIDNYINDGNGWKDETGKLISQPIQITLSSSASHAKILTLNLDGTYTITENTVNGSKITNYYADGSQILTEEDLNYNLDQYNAQLEILKNNDEIKHYNEIEEEMTDFQNKLIEYINELNSTGTNNNNLSIQTLISDPNMQNLIRECIETGDYKYISYELIQEYLISTGAANTAIETLTFISNIISEQHELQRQIDCQISYYTNLINEETVIVGYEQCMLNENFFDYCKILENKYSIGLGENGIISDLNDVFDIYSEKYGEGDYEGIYNSSELFNTVIMGENNLVLTIAQNWDEIYGFQSTNDATSMPYNEELMELIKKVQVMSEKEIETYTYLFNTRGPLSANGYLNALDNKINMRIGLYEAERWLNTVENDGGGLSLVEAFTEGIDNGTLSNLEGFQNILATGSISAEQYKTMYIGSILNEYYPHSDAISYSAGTSLGNMLPMVALNILGLGILGPGEMFVTTYGNSYNQALASGYSNEDAIGYAVSIASIETLGDALLSSLPGVGSKVFGLDLAGILKIDNKFLEILLDMGQEAMTENVQNILEGIAGEQFLSEEYNLTLEEITDTTMVSIILSVVMGGAGKTFNILTNDQLFVMSSEEIREILEKNGCTPEGLQQGINDAINNTENPTTEQTISTSTQEIDNSEIKDTTYWEKYYGSNLNDSNSEVSSIENSEQTVEANPTTEQTSTISEQITEYFGIYGIEIEQDYINQIEASGINSTEIQQIFDKATDEDMLEGMLNILMNYNKTHNTSLYSLSIEEVALIYGLIKVGQASNYVNSDGTINIETFNETIEKSKKIAEIMQENNRTVETIMQENNCTIEEAQEIATTMIIYNCTEEIALKMIDYKEMLIKQGLKPADAINLVTFHDNWFNEYRTLKTRIDFTTSTGVNIPKGTEIQLLENDAVKYWDSLMNKNSGTLQDITTQIGMEYFNAIVASSYNPTIGGYEVSSGYQGNQFEQYVMPPRVGTNPATGKPEFYIAVTNSDGILKPEFLGNQHTGSIGRFDSSGNDCGQFAILDLISAISENKIDATRDGTTWYDKWNKYAGLGAPTNSKVTIFLTQYAPSAHAHSGTEGGSNNWAVPGNIIPGGITEVVVPSIEINYRLNAAGEVVVDFTSEMNNMSVTLVDNITGETQTFSLEDYYKKQGYIINIV